MIFDPELYPTPRDIASKMLAKISKDAANFLDPNGGTGALAEVAKGEDSYHSYRKNVDCIEINPELAHVLRGKGFPVVGYDWLAYTGVSYYDAIVMNPPFSNGDEHLLKAWDFIHDGEIVCLLNQETIDNPYTERRQRLVKLIMEHGDVEPLGKCFRGADRPTDVSVALVYLKKEAEDDRAELWGIKTEEKPVDDSIGPEDAMLAIRDELGNMQHYYDMANEEMFKAFNHIRKATIYMEANGISRYGSSGDKYDHILATAMGNTSTARAEYGRKHRKDAWEHVFHKMQFHKWLDKQQREALLRDVAREMHLPFTAENIQGTLDNIFEQRRRLFEQSAANVFDELVRHYKGNAASEGWKTNDNYKVNEKLILPYGCEWDDIFDKFRLRYDGAIDIYNDLDRVLCVMDNSRFEECLTVGRALEYAFGKLGRHVTRPNTCQSSYFKIRFFKKGTVHLEFTDLKIWEQFNITAAAGKKWLGQNTDDTSEFPGRRTEHNASRQEEEPIESEPNPMAVTTQGLFNLEVL